MCLTENKVDDIILECIELAKKEIKGKPDKFELIIDATKHQLQIKQKIEAIKLSQENLNEEQITKLKGVLEKFNEYIEKVKRIYKSYIKFKQSIERITKEPIKKALKNMRILEACIEDIYFVGEVIDECYKYPYDYKTKKYKDYQAYHCICGWNPLRYLFVFEHDKVDKPFIIGSRCISHIEEYLLFETNAEVATSFKILLDSYNTNKHKQNKKKCRGCGEIKVTKKNGKIPYKNVYCSECIIEKDNLIKVKCNNNCSEYFEYKPGWEKCGLCYIYPDRPSKLKSFSF